MAARNSYTGIDEYVVKVVRLTAHALVRRGGFREEDREDLEQELMLDVLHRLPRFDAERAAYRTFVTRVVTHRAARLVMANRSGNAAGRRAARSLHDDVEDADGGNVEMWETLDEDAGRRGLGCTAEHADETRDLRLDVAAAAATLPSELREICAWLLHHSVTDTAHGTGLPRVTLWRRMQPIRAHFAAAGLDVYMPTHRALLGTRE